MDDVSDENKKFVLDVEVKWEPVEESDECHHMVKVSSR